MVNLSSIDGRESNNSMLLIWYILYKDNKYSTLQHNIYNILFMIYFYLSFYKYQNIMKFAHFIVVIRKPISINKYIIWTQQNYTIVTLPLRFVTVSLTFQIEEIEQFSRKRTLSLLFVYTKQPFFFSLISHLFNAKVCSQCTSFGLIYSRNSGILRRKQPQPSRPIKFF